MALCPLCCTLRCILDVILMNYLEILGLCALKVSLHVCTQAIVNVHDCSFSFFFAPNVDESKFTYIIIL